MEVEIIIKEVREQVGKSLRELSEATGINRQRLSDIENHIIKEDEILFIEMLVIAKELEKTILDLYRTKAIEIKGIGEI